jgi:hypothetical protein
VCAHDASVPSPRRRQATRTPGGHASDAGSDWNDAYGSVTIRKVRQVFPMFELTVDGLTAAVKKFMVRY